MTNIQYCIARANKQLADEGQTVLFEATPPPPIATQATPAKTPAGPTRAQREAWLRNLREQAKTRKKEDAARNPTRLEFEETRPAIEDENARALEIERQREAQLFSEAESEIRRRHAAEANPCAH